MDDKKQPIVVKKVNKIHSGHHGGAWKVAYADFVTAMMAFFLLMWLLGSTSQSDREGIQDFFQDPVGIQGPGGASTSMIELGDGIDMSRGEGEDLAVEPPEPESQEEKTAEDYEEDLEDKVRLDALMQKLKEQIESSPTLRNFKKQLLLDITSEGLRIQIVDDKNRPMFSLGSARLKWYTREILHEIAKTIKSVPNYTSIAGHTDATPYSEEMAEEYSNWELSADRSNAARRELVVGGMKVNKFGRVVGLASSVLFNKEKPYAPVNRRISIIVLNKFTERAIGLKPLDMSDGDGKPEADASASSETSATEPVVSPEHASDPQEEQTAEDYGAVFNDLTDGETQ
ncbi:MAG: flagellar motor protein MotB [Gammaproteobacteria bacterium]|nr:flagellar motor protein MotB [Gammaproteobacteria bacterium]